MTGRIVLAAVVAGLAMFAWQAAANLLMPWASLAVGPVADEASVREVVVDEAPESGVYFMPYDEHAADPTDATVFLAVRHDGPLPFSRALSAQLAANVLALLLAAVLLHHLALGHIALRVGAVTAFGIIGWLVGSLPHYIWWGFDAAFVGVELLNTGIGWALAGTVLAIGTTPSFDDGGPGRLPKGDVGTT